MSIFTNTSKSSLASVSNVSKHSVGFSNNQEKSGQAWKYNQSQMTYNQTADPITGSRVYYNSLGLLPTYTNVSKS